jgi:diaminopimelate epimerase
MRRFAKAHACGNDFLIMEGECDRELAVNLCARHTGIGADGVEFLTWTGERSGKIQLVNADGSIAEISGNGTRCVAAWMVHHIQTAQQRSIEAGATIDLETDAGLRSCRLVHAEGHQFEFASAMGVPAIRNRRVTLKDGTSVDGIEVSTGNPHFVIPVDGKEGDDFLSHDRHWEEMGRQICFHRDFPEQTNVEFVRVLTAKRIAIRIYERGVGPTTSSGTGTCATAAATMFQRGSTGSLQVSAPGGDQRVDWDNLDSELILTGPAELIATGEAW